MTDNEQEPFFKCLDDNTLFTAAYSWIHENDTIGGQELRTAVGTWTWADVGSVQMMDDRSFVELESPRCCVMLLGGPIHLRAEYQTVLTAWRKYRKRYVSPFLLFQQPN